MALFAAFFVSFPVIANQLWAFVAPGLYAKEKKAFLPFLIATPVLFIAGAALAYYVVMPTAFRWFLGFRGRSRRAQARGAARHRRLSRAGDAVHPRVRDQLPAAGAADAAQSAGIVSRAQLVGARRYVIVAIFVVAAIATPPDVVSQLLLAVPLMLLFEGTLVLMRITEKSPRARGCCAEEETEADERSGEEIACRMRRGLRSRPGAAAGGSARWYPACRRQSPEPRHRTD